MAEATSSGWSKTHNTGRDEEAKRLETEMKREWAQAYNMWSSIQRDEEAYQRLDEPGRQEWREYVQAKRDMAFRRFEAAELVKSARAKDTIRFAREAIEAFKDAAKDYVDNERPPVEERISSPSSSEEEEEEKTGPTEDMTAPMPTKVSTAEWVGPPADVPVEPSVTHAILLELKAAWKEAELLWSNVEDLKTKETEAHGEMEAGRQELMAALSQKRLAAWERYQAAKATAKQAGSENWQFVSDTIQEFMDSANRFLGRTAASFSEGQDLHARGRKVPASEGRKLASEGIRSETTTDLEI